MKPRRSSRLNRSKPAARSQGKPAGDPPGFPLSMARWRACMPPAWAARLNPAGLWTQDGRLDRTAWAVRTSRGREAPDPPTAASSTAGASVPDRTHPISRLVACVAALLAAPSPVDGAAASSSAARSASLPFAATSCRRARWLQRIGAGNGVDGFGRESGTGEASDFEPGVRLRRRGRGQEPMTWTGRPMRAAQQETRRFRPLRLRAAARKTCRRPYAEAHPRPMANVAAYRLL